MVLKFCNYEICEFSLFSKCVDINFPGDLKQFQSLQLNVPCKNFIKRRRTELVKILGRMVNFSKKKKLRIPRRRVFFCAHLRLLIFHAINK